MKLDRLRSLGFTVRAALILSCFVGCGNDAPAVESTESALGQVALPQGLTCGLGYYRAGVDYVRPEAACEGHLTAWASSGSPQILYICGNSNIGKAQAWYQPCDSGYHVAADGDYGDAAPYGFYHQSLTTSTATITDPSMLALPKGTACGFKESCNDRGETCLGVDPWATGTCPNGWTLRIGSDSQGNVNCGYVWCEYQDPHGVCTGNCQLANQPSGIVCGIDDNDRHNGQCLGVQTDTGCPAGWTHEGFYDDGRSVGHGLAWCTKG